MSLKPPQSKSKPQPKSRAVRQTSQHLEEILDDPTFINYCKDVASTPEFHLLMEAVTLVLKKNHKLNSSLPEYIFRHNQAVRETAEIYRQTMIDIIFSDRSKDKAISETEMAD